MDEELLTEGAITMESQWMLWYGSSLIYKEQQENAMKR